MDRLFGIGLGNAIGLFLFFIIGIVVLKVVLTKHPIDGVTDFVNNI